MNATPGGGASGDPPGAADVPLVDTRWVHAFEEDGADGAVYRPEAERFPLSRRPRRRIELFADGSARVSDGGPDDRLRAAAAEWSLVDGRPLIRCAGGECLRVVGRGPRRLVIEKVPPP